MDEITVTLPWFPPELRPNASSPGNWRKKTNAAKVYRTRCGWLAKLVKPELPNGKLPLYVTFYPPDNRNRDLDNCLAAIKSGIDGICNAWRVNDSRFRPITIDMGPVEKNGKIIVKILLTAVNPPDTVPSEREEL